MMKSHSVLHKEQKMEFEKINCFFVDFLKYNFERIKVVPTVFEKKYTPQIMRQICFAYQLTGFYMIRGFTERYFLANYMLENLFYFVNASVYCFKPSLSRIFCVNSPVKVLSPRSHLFCTSSLCTFIIYRKKEIGFAAKFFSKYFFGQKVIPNYMSS